MHNVKMNVDIVKYLVLKAKIKKKRTFNKKLRFPLVTKSFELMLCQY